MFKALSVLLLAAILFIGGLLASGDDATTVAILRFGSFENATLSSTETALADVLLAYELITPGERVALGQRQDMENDRLRVIWGDAGYDFAQAALMAEAAIDDGADVLVAISGPVAQAALNVTADMDAPPALIFASVFNPVESGIVDSVCVKPPHVTGVEARTPYEDIIPLLQLQAPDLQIIGTIFNPAEASGALGAQAIVAAGEGLGLQVEQAAVTGAADLRAATQGLLNKGVEILMLPVDQTTLAGFPAILSIANDNGIPIFHANSRSTTIGTTVGAGFELFYEQGVRAGRILVSYLDGELDIAATGISAETDMSISVNLDSAAAQGVEIAPELLEMAGRVIEDGQIGFSVQNITRRMLGLGMGADDVPEMMQVIQAGVPAGEGTPSAVTQIMVMAMQYDSAMAAAQAFVDSLHCTDEIVAEQEAALQG